MMRLTINLASCAQIRHFWGFFHWRPIRIKDIIKVINHINETVKAFKVAPRRSFRTLGPSSE